MLFQFMCISTLHINLKNMKTFSHKKHKSFASNFPIIFYKIWLFWLKLLKIDSSVKVSFRMIKFCNLLASSFIAKLIKTTYSLNSQYIFFTIYFVLYLIKRFQYICMGGLTGFYQICELNCQSFFAKLFSCSRSSEALQLFNFNLIGI